MDDCERGFMAKIMQDSTTASAFWLDRGKKILVEMQCAAVKVFVWSEFGGVFTPLGTGNISGGFQNTFQATGTM